MQPPDPDASWRPRPTPMSHPWAFDDDPPPRRTGVAVGLIMAVVCCAALTIMAYVFVGTMFEEIVRALLHV